MRTPFLALAICLMLPALGGCEPAPEAPSMGSLMGGDSQGFAEVKPGHPLTFPQDHLAHGDFRQEWWYLTANLQTLTGEPLGLQWTQFRVALAPQQAELPNPADSRSPNSWATGQLYFAHAALTQSDFHHSAEKWSRGHPALAGVAASPFSVYLDNWRWQGLGQDVLPATLEVDTEEFAYRLRLRALAPLQLQGDGGFSRKQADGELASYYYSQPFIHIEGQVRSGKDGDWQEVNGQGWLDREWSSNFLGPEQQGWDWFGLHLDDGSALMLFRLRSRDGSFYISGRRMWPDGHGETLTDISLTELEHRGDRPLRWRLKLPQYDMLLSLSPLNPDAEMALSLPYWEGPVQLEGKARGEKVSGQGYMELTGYRGH
ncbi:carotenoid 1,2-hydratase [Shewanella cyperi]|uniref:Carotenoid 1,2-hydratase n=1 Tax=Shewanella cyperi TaxID=2814292 RepID=A0A975ALR1_9GAMM|nr:lipocalin-like domain-containing protein [Shewanella cyperi]QSX30662.1 carotenoid 1,2-hydratase [Shewanella cyperi]